MIDGYPDQVISSAYTSIINRFADKQTQEEMRKEIHFIITGHMVPTLPFYLDALGKVGTVALLVPKNSTPDSETRKWVDEKSFRVLEHKDAREHLRTNWQEYVKTESPCKVIIIDIGGYFAPAMKEYVKNDLPGVNILGYVEDTENGYQKYFANMPEMKINCEKRAETMKVDKRDSIFESVPPIISVARSQIKESEDYNVGKAITDATDHVLRTKYYTHLAESKTILVIGYGKIGSAAAQVASQKTRGPVLVCEIDNVRKLKASAHSFVVVDLFEGLKQADVIISCTGNKCLGAEHIEYIKHNAYISSCTSKDDEFNKSFMDALVRDPDTDSYSVGSKIINLLNGGNSINFIEKAVHGYFIHGVLASLIVSAITIFKNDKKLIEPALQRDSINDFNDLKNNALQGGVNASYQSIVAGILMREKLRTGPSVTNFRLTKKKVIPRNDERKELENRLYDHSHCLVIGKKKAGKSHIVNQFFYFNKQYYDIAWKFDGSDLDTQCNHLLEELKNVYPGETKDLLVSNLSKFLQDFPHPYLLVFENAKKDIPEFLKSSGVKREHVILTTKQESETLENVLKPFQNVKNHLLLKPYPREELFKLVVDDSEFCESMDSKITDLLSKMEKEIKEKPRPHDASVSQKLMALLDNKRMLPYEDKSGSDNASFIPIANIVALYLKYSTKKDRELDAISNLDNTQMLLYVIEKLSEKAKKLLFLFHILQRKKVAYLKKEIERRYDTNTIKELIKYGWIEEEIDDGEYLVSINLKYYNKVVEDRAENVDKEFKLLAKAVTLTLQDRKTKNVVARNQVVSVVHSLSPQISLSHILRFDVSPNEADLVKSVGNIRGNLLQNPVISHLKQKAYKKMFN